MTRLKIGAVPFVNALPLIEGLAADAELVFDTPAALERRLAADELDAGLLPVASLFDRPDWTPVGDWGIASDRASGSVLYFSRPGVGAPARVALDERSRTSALLLKHLLGPSAEYISMSGGLDAMLEAASGALVIGDDALRLQDDPRLAFDLAARWRERHGLPFVFAVWAAASDHPRRGRIEQILDRAARAGTARLDALAGAAAARLGLSPDRARRYFCEQLCYRLTGPHREAIAKFEELTVPLRRPAVAAGGS